MKMLKRYVVKQDIKRMMIETLTDYAYKNGDEIEIDGETWEIYYEM